MQDQLESPRGKRILLVDDDRATREIVREALAIDHHSVIEANNGAEALGLYARHTFDLVLTDGKMPFICGDELALRIRQLSPFQPILMMTGHGLRAGHKNPVNAVLHKPFELSTFRSTVATLLRFSRTCMPEPASQT